MRVLLSAEDIAETVARLGERISRDLAGGVTLVVVLRGAAVFAADLLRRLHVPTNVEYLLASSYGDAQVSSGRVQVAWESYVAPGAAAAGDAGGDTAGAPASVSGAVVGQDVVIVDDLCDSGRTLAALSERLRARGAASVRTCVLLDKRARREVEFTPDYVGVAIEDSFVVGYGMDAAGRWRELPDLCVLEPDDASHAPVEAPR